MFIYTAKISKKKVIMCIIIVGVILMAIILMRPKTDAYTVLSEKETDAIMASITVGGIETNEDRRIFLSERGYEVSSNEVYYQQIQIPTEFDDIYNNYNQIQLEQGFDLTKFKGKAVEIYTYEIYNYDDADDQIFANILIYNGKIIGGDIQSSKLDGFITGFEKN